MGIFNVKRESKFSTVTGFYALSTIHGFIAVFVLMLILVSGQIVENAVRLVKIFVNSYWKSAILI